MPELCIVLLTAPDWEMAHGLGRTLVDERLAACANLVPQITSIYRWEDAIHEDSEVLLIVKTTQASVPALTERVLALHPYAVPEVIALPIGAGSATYLAWLVEQVG